jgi:hypothetical protein
MMRNVKGATPAGLPVWWCRFDNMVIFDGMLKDGDTGEWIPMTRSSKGLPISNAKGQEESALLELQCNHCKTLLDLHIWRYSTKVCQRSVCTGCKVRCRQEYFRMMKEGHSFNHFEKVSQDPVTDEAVLARISTPELTKRILEPTLAQRTAPSEAAYFVPASIHSPVEAKTKVESPTVDTVAADALVPVVDQFEFLQPVAHLPGHYELGTPQTEQSNFLLPLPSPEVMGTLTTRTFEPEPVLHHSPEVNESFQQIVSQDELHDSLDRTHDGTSPQFSHEDIGLAITLHSPGSPIPQMHTFAPQELTQSLPQLTTEFVMPDMPQEVLFETPQLEQPESPQSEHPSTPTFEPTELPQATEDLLSPGLKDERFDEEEPFDISLYIKNLDTNEVTTLPVEH